MSTAEAAAAAYNSPKRRYKIRVDGSDNATLDSYEIFWRDRFLFFEAHGYRLRPRFRPGWIPSWYAKDVYHLRCEDSVFGTVSQHFTLTF